jgi:hypothetical protein
VLRKIADFAFPKMIHFAKKLRLFGLNISQVLSCVFTQLFCRKNKDLKSNQIITSHERYAGTVNIALPIALF